MSIPPNTTGRNLIDIARKIAGWEKLYGTPTYDLVSLRLTAGEAIGIAKALIQAEEALKELQNGTDDPSITLSGDYHTGLMCGVEDGGFQTDGYAAASYGFENGVERTMDWALGIAKTTLDTLHSPLRE